MKDPARLVNEDATDLERSLLEAGMSEGPSERSMRQTAAAIGLSTAAGLSAQTAAGAGTSAVPVGAMLKWIGIGIAGGVVVATIGYGVIRSSSEPPPSPAPTEAKVAAQPAVDDEPPASDVSPTDLEPEPEVAASPDAPAPRASAPRPTPGDSLKDQVARLDAAREKLAAGQPQAALTALDRYRRDYPKGALGQEAMLLRIEALAQLGNRSAARALATRFLQRQPRSAHRQRIESLVGKIETE